MKTQKSATFAEKHLNMNMPMKSLEIIRKLLEIIATMQINKVVLHVAHAIYNIVHLKKLL